MKIFRIILLAIIAASGGHFVEALDMCKTKDDCEKDCLKEFDVKFGGRHIDLRNLPLGVCQEDLEKVATFTTEKELLLQYKFGEACDFYERTGYDNWKIVNTCLGEIAGIP
eukprot:GHVS01101088.1.p1 GENE.GHVS01101088.1~~GHVS01101088.1.p1  ORF type:complete len:111 (+),score=10.89 GHVS01101088.1:599-931(+)